VTLWTQPQLQGLVRDSQGRPVAAASVYHRLEGGTQPLTAHTDSAGDFRFSELGEGVYTLRAELAGYTEATFGPCVLGGKETKEVDLTLGPQKGFRSGKQSASFDTPQFFDEPEFTVAGVTEAMNPGGHGSDTILQSSEALERDTVSLKDAPSSSRLVPSPQRKSLCARQLNTSPEILTQIAGSENCSPTKEIFREHFPI